MTAVTQQSQQWHADQASHSSAESAAALTLKASFLLRSDCSHLKKFMVRWVNLRQCVVTSAYSPSSSFALSVYRVCFTSPKMKFQVLQLISCSGHAVCETIRYPFTVAVFNYSIPWDPGAVDSGKQLMNLSIQIHVGIWLCILFMICVP